jgi:hypothetical protein
MLAAKGVSGFSFIASPVMRLTCSPFDTRRLSSRHEASCALAKIRARDVVVVAALRADHAAARSAERLGQSPINRRTADLNRLGNFRRPHAVRLQLPDLVRINRGRASFVDSRRLGLGDTLYGEAKTCLFHLRNPNWVRNRQRFACVGRCGVLVLLFLDIPRNVYKDQVHQTQQDLHAAGTVQRDRCVLRWFGSRTPNRCPLVHARASGFLLAQSLQASAQRPPRRE